MDPNRKYSILKLLFFLSESLHTLKRQNGIIRGQALVLDCLNLSPSFMVCLLQFPLVYIEIIGLFLLLSLLLLIGLLGRLNELILARF